MDIELKDQLLKRFGKVGSIDDVYHVIGLFNHTPLVTDVRRAFFKQGGGKRLQERRDRALNRLIHEAQRHGLLKVESGLGGVKLTDRGSQFLAACDAYMRRKREELAAIQEAARLAGQQAEGISGVEEQLDHVEV